MSEQNSTNPTSTNPTPNDQARVLELLIQSLGESLRDRDLQALEGLFKQGAALTHRLLEGAEGALHPEWTAEKPAKERKSAAHIQVG